MTDAKVDLDGFEERFADARAVRMRYFVAGDGPSVMLLHGLAGAAANWALLAPALAGRYRVLVPELPGHGGSAPLPAAASVDAFAQRVGLVAEHEGMLPTAVVGHSMGGLVALRLALRRPEAVTGVVLAGAAGIASTTRWAQFWLTVLGHLRLGRRIEPFTDQVARSRILRYPVFGYWGASDPAALSQDAVAALLAGPELHTDTLSAGRALVLDDPRVDLVGVRCPCLVLWGSRDHQVPLGDAFEYARRLRASLRTIADCGHLLIAERPDACFDAITEFLDRVRHVDELPREAESVR